MLLAVEVGNTKIMAATFAGRTRREIRKTWRMNTHPMKTVDEFRANFHEMLGLEGLTFSDLTAVVVSSVVPAWTPVLRVSFEQLPIRVPFHVIDSSWPFSFENHTDAPEKVGVDRLVNAEAALREHGAPVLVLDAGTATTLSAVVAGDSKSQGPGERARFLGGAIMPGIEMFNQGLAQGGAQLFALELADGEKPARAVGRNTREALTSGVVLGYASMVAGMIERFRSELGLPQAPVIATGGASRYLEGLVPAIGRVDRELTLKGIEYLYESFCS